MNEAALNPAILDSATPPPTTMTTLQIGDRWLQEKDGGLQRFYYELLRHLPGTGTDYKGLVVGTENVRHLSGGKVVAFAEATTPLPKRLLQCRQVGNSLGKYDLISVHFGLYGFPLLDRLSSMPSVIQFQGPWAGESGAEREGGLSQRLKFFIESQVYRRADRFLVLSQSFREELARRYGVREDLIDIVPGGVDIHRFNMEGSRKEARERLGWPADRFIALCVRRLVRRMGLENLLDAAHLLVAKHPELLILIGGAGPLTGELQQRIDTLGLGENVQLLGRVSDEDLPLAYRAADMSIVPTQALEGFGLITLESMACGTPVLVTPVGGLPETILPLAPQCVFSDTSTAEIAEVFGEFLSGARQFPTPERCREYTVAGYSWPRVAQMVRAVYDKAAAQ